VTAQPHEPITQAEFPAWELRQETKHEFVDRHVYGFAGGTIEHNTLAAEVLAAVLAFLRGTSCRTFGPDMLIEMASSTRYADIAVTCDERDRIKGATVIRFPKLIIEVLSESTAGTDLGTKLREYQRIETLEEYVMIDSHKRWVQAIRRRGHEWILAVLTPADDATMTTSFESIGLWLQLNELYEIAGVD
jgi:Uma2 family endonuclease